VPHAEVSESESSGEAQLGETQPSRLDEDGINLPPEIPEEPAETPRRRHLWILWAVAAVLLLALIAGGSAFAGYNSAVDQRTHYESTLVAGEANNQYILAKQDIALGNFDRARQRLEYIINIDPEYPDASNQLAFVLAQQRITATPTVIPSPTLTPTPDLRGRDDLFAQAQSQLVSRDWTGTIDTLLLLRKNYPDFMAVKVDDMLFVALRNRGIDKISLQHDLEGGNYDLTLAERFGPLDAEARNWRDWADLYIRGASYWDVDWSQAVYYFSQLASAAPNLMDASGWTASNRYLDALLGYGDYFALHEQWCDAQTQFDTYMSMMANPQVEPTASYIADQCYQQLNPPAPPAPVTDTPTPTGTPGAETTPYPSP
jgi:tetratricopeptide (TPR) repeat protein